MYGYLSIASFIVDTIYVCSDSDCNYEAIDKPWKHKNTVKIIKNLIEISSVPYSCKQN